MLDAGKEEPLYYEKEETGPFSFLAGLAIGVLIGATAALLAAPQSGKRTRRQILRAVADARRSVGTDWEGATREFKRAVRSSRHRMKR